jgi:hypothetical protein
MIIDIYDVIAVNHLLGLPLAFMPGDLNIRSYTNVCHNKGMIEEYESIVNGKICVSCLK